MRFMDKIKVFETELKWIKSSEIRNFAEKAVSLLPDYFFEVAASSTGKYHPTYAIGPGGLVRHTKAAVSIAHELLSLEMYEKYTSDEKDLMLTALILHDGWKHGKSEKAGAYTVAEHPAVCSEWIQETEILSSLLPEEQIEFLCGCIASHMGQWNTDYRTKKEILPKPKTAAQKFVHQADYLASRKYLIYDFGDSYYRPGNSPDESKKEDQLNTVKSKIVALCKEKISSGVNSSELYALIAEKTGGSKNPNSITDVGIANEVLSAISNLNKGDSSGK